MIRRPFHRRRVRRSGFILVVALVILFAIASLVLTLGRAGRAESQASANEVASFEASATERGAEQYVLSILTDDFDSVGDLTEADWARIPVGKGLFWVIRPDYLDNDLPQFGLVDESSKINLNTVDVATLSLMPNMTDDIAGSIINWRSDSTAQTTTGAQAGDYLGLPDPYSAKNAPFESVEELSMVRGVTRQLLYGELGTGLSSGTSTALGSDAVGHDGWFDFFTIYGTLAPTAGTAPAVDPINVNSAPAAVLRCLPGLTDDDVNALLAARTAAVQNDPTSTQWFNDTLKGKASGIATRIIGQGKQFSADIVAVSGNGRAFKRVRIVVDTSQTPAAIVYRRDLTDGGFPLDPSILTSLRNGGGTMNGGGGTSSSVGGGF